MLILLVEDEPNKARTLERILLRATVGVDVEHVTNLSDALLRVDEADLVVTDWSFPMVVGRPTPRAGASLVDVCRDLEKPFVVVSGSPKPEGFKGAWIVSDNALEELPLYLVAAGLSHA